MPIIKQNENLNTNTLNILNSKNYCIDDKIKEEQLIKDIEINSHDFKKDLNNEAKDDHNEININNKDLNDDDQQLLKIIRFLQNMKYYNSNDKNNINKILNIYLKQSINSFSNIISFLYLNRLYNLFQKINLQNILNNLNDIYNDIQGKSQRNEENKDICININTTEDEKKRK